MPCHFGTDLDNMALDEGVVGPLVRDQVRVIPHATRAARPSPTTATVSSNGRLRTDRVGTAGVSGAGSDGRGPTCRCDGHAGRANTVRARSEEHTSELQSRPPLVCRLLLAKKIKNKTEH